MSCACAQVQMIASIIEFFSATGRCPCTRPVFLQPDSLRVCVHLQFLFRHSRILSTSVTARENSAFVWINLAVTISPLTWNLQSCFQGQRNFSSPFIHLRRGGGHLYCLPPTMKANSRTWSANTHSENTSCENARLLVSHALDGVRHPSACQFCFLHLFVNSFSSGFYIIGSPVPVSSHTASTFIFFSKIKSRTSVRTQAPAMSVAMAVHAFSGTTIFTDRDSSLLSLLPSQ